MTQPQVAKHLGVLRAVGLVSVRVDGRHRWYRVNGPALQPISDWVRTFARTWNARLDRLDALGNRHGSAVITVPPRPRRLSE